MKNLSEYIFESVNKVLYEFMDKLKKDKAIFATDQIKEEYNIKELTITKTIHDNDSYITLNKIIMNSKGNGLGSRFMRDLCSWADDHDIIICLTPSDTFGATSINRLKKFYKKFGFIDNKGAKSDFNHRESMYRKPHS